MCMKKFKFNRQNNISIVFLRLVFMLTKLDNQIRNYGTDTPLHVAETHMIKAVKDHPGIHVTALADILGVTKGAVSQMLQKLVKKEMIFKTPDPKNQSRLILALTPKGETAYYYHEKLHEDFNNLFMNSVKDSTPEKIHIIQSFLETLESNILEYTESEKRKKRF